MSQSLFVLPPVIDAAAYLPPREAAKVAGIRLQSPPAAWADEILQTLIRDHPYLPLDQCVVNFRQRDDAMGYAIGFIGVMSAPNVSIPVIVTRGELKPLDLMILRQDSPGEGGDTDVGVGNTTDDKVMALTEENYQRAVDGTPMGDVAMPMDGRGTGFTEDGSAIRLPMRGRTVLASVMGATEEQKTAFVNILESDKSVLAGFTLGDVGQAADAWLAAGAPAKTFASKLASAPLPRGAAMIVDELPQIIPAAEANGARVFLADGSSKTAAVFETVSLLSPAAGTQRILVFEDQSYVPAPAELLASKTAETDAVAHIVSSMVTGSISRGDTLMFAFDEGVTAPAKVAGVAVDDSTRSILVQCVDGLGGKTNVVFSPAVKVAMFGDTGWVLPTTTRVLRVGEYATEYSQPVTVSKAAQAIERLVPDALYCNGASWSLNSKTAAAHAVPKAKMAFLLGALVTNGAELMATAEATGVVRFDMAADPAIAAQQKIAAAAAALPDVAKAIVDELRMPLDKAVKLAATIGRADGADAVLATGFLNEDNLAEFVQMAGSFKDTVNNLARLLMAIRMGYPGDENATAVAMKSLQRVAERLESVQAEIG
jgi:hypothetical protein